MYYQNAKIYTQDFRFQAGAFSVENGRFAQILPESVPADAVDLQGAYVIPGLVDVHNHGNSGRDFSDGDYEGLKTMAAYLGRCGVTSFAPASRRRLTIWRLVVPRTMESSMSTILLSFTDSLIALSFILT